jgi:hypothetical protein
MSLTALVFTKVAAGYDEIQFTASHTVTTIHKPEEVLKGSQVRVRSVCSLISSVRY